MLEEEKQEVSPDVIKFQMTDRSHNNNGVNLMSNYMDIESEMTTNAKNIDSIS